MGIEHLTITPKYILLEEYDFKSEKLIHIYDNYSGNRLILKQFYEEISQMLTKMPDHDDAYHTWTISL